MIQFNSSRLFRSLMKHLHERKFMLCPPCHYEDPECWQDNMSPVTEAKLQCGIFRMSPPPSPLRPGLWLHHTFTIGGYFDGCFIDIAVLGILWCVMLGCCHTVWEGQVVACVEIKVSYPGPALNTGLIVSWDMAAITLLKTELNIHCCDAVKTGDSATAGEGGIMASPEPN